MTWREHRSLRDRDRDEIDPVVEGLAHQLAPDVALAIWERVCREATDAYGLRDDERALRRFHQVAALVAARGGRLPPPTPPGRVPLVGGHGRPRRRDPFAVIAPGKVTRVMAELERWQRRMPAASASDPDAVRVVSPDRAMRAAVRGEVLTIAHVLALDPGGLEIVIDETARSRLAAAGVRGMQDGHAVYLHPDLYRPGSEDGRYLLAHELVHLAQRKLPAHPSHGPRAAEAEATALGLRHARGHGLAPPAIGLTTARAAHDEPGSPDAKLLAEPPSIVRSVQMFSIHYRPRVDGAKWTAGLDKKREALAIVLRDLVGASAYSVRLLDELIAARGGLHAIEVTGTLDGQATQDERITPFTVRGWLILELVDWLAASPRGLKVNLSADQRATLERGLDAMDTWAAIRPELPAWAHDGLYAAVMGAAQATLLGRYGRAQRLAVEHPTSVSRRARDAVHAEVIRAIAPAFRALEAVRVDRQLVGRAAYRVLWDLPAIPPGTRVELSPADAATPPPPAPGLYFLLDAHAYPELARSAPANPAARRELLARFELRLGTHGIPRDGDAVLHDGPIRTTRPPLESSLVSYPPLDPMHFDSPEGGDREFVMNLEFSDVFEAFRGYIFKWELIEVPHDDLAQLAATADAPGDPARTPGLGALLGQRLGRDVEDGRADIRRSVGNLTGLLGPPGVGATTAVAANAMVRMVGTVLRTFIEALVKPRNQKTMPFARDGLYVVRCIAHPRPREAAVADRAPSVAWLPVWVRPARDMSRLRARELQRLADGMRTRRAEIDAQLADTTLSPDTRAALVDEAQQIDRASNASGGELLAQERAGLVAAQPTAAGHDREAIAKRIAEIDRIVELRRGRLAGAAGDGSLEAVTRIPTVFVGRDGRTLAPLFEVFQRPSRGTQRSYDAVDSTTANGGHRSGTGATRDDAIADAIQRVLESDQGYGRGHATLIIPPAPSAGSSARPVERTIRIEKSTGALLAEAIDNLATVASIAAVAAAPLTGGASLALLVPIGVIGAIPSAYRLIDRGMQGTLRLDMATALDVVNLLGAAVGGGQAAATGRAALRGVPVGRGWLIVGLGSDGLGALVVGAGVLDQIHELNRDPNMPPGLRSAMIAQIIGGQLIQLGIAAGAQLYMRGKAQQEQLGGKARAVEHPLIEPQLEDRFRAAVGPHGEAIRIYRDPDGKQVAGAGVEIHYQIDGYGLPGELHVIAGPGAGLAELLVHARAARAMLEQRGLLGYLRNLRDRLVALFKGGAQPPRPGSRAWEAKLELEHKLPEAIRQIYSELGSGKLAPEVARSRLADLRDQMLVHERALDEVGAGRGFIAAHDQVTARALEAGYPRPPSDHFYFETGDGKYQLQRNASSDAAAHHIAWHAGKPVLASGPAPRAATTLDLTALRLQIADWLGVAADTVVIHPDAPGVERVSVRPPAQAGDRYEIHFKRGTSEAALQAAIAEHRELAARRPAGSPAAPPSRQWTAIDEAAFHGTIPAELIEQARSHGIEAVRWASATLTTADAKPLFAALGKPAILALGDIPATRARDLLDVFGAPLLDRVAPAVGGKRLAAEVELLGPHTARPMIEKDVRKGNIQKIATHSDRLESQRQEIESADALGDSAVIVDSQVMIAVRKFLSQDTWTSTLDNNKISPLEFVIVNRLRARAGLPPLTGMPAQRDPKTVIGSQDLRAANVALGESGPGLGVHAMRLVVRRGDATYNHMLEELAKGRLPIGGPAGFADRAVVADALFAEVTGQAPPVLMTADDDIYVRLAQRYSSRKFKQRMVDGRLESLADAIVREAPNGFPIEIIDRNGIKRRLTVIPLS